VAAAALGNDAGSVSRETVRTLARETAARELHEKVLQIAGRHSRNSASLTESPRLQALESLPGLERQRLKPAVIQSLWQGELVELTQSVCTELFLSQIPSIFELNVCPRYGLT
jgi:hypothetical protein